MLKLQEMWRSDLGIYRPVQEGRVPGGADQWHELQSKEVLGRQAWKWQWRIRKMPARL